MTDEPRGLYSVVLSYTQPGLGQPRRIHSVGMARDEAGDIYLDRVAYLLSDGSEIERSVDWREAHDAWMSGDIFDEADIPAD